jgi:putative ABC transport system permease protein
LALGLLLAHALVPAAVAGYTFLPIVSAGKLVVKPASVIGVMGAGTWIAVAGALLAARQVTKIQPVEAMRPSPSTSFELGTNGPGHAATRQLRVGLVALGLAVALAAAYLTHTKQTALAAAAEALVIVGVALLLPTLMRKLLGRLPSATAKAKGASGRLAFHGLAQQPGRTALTVGALGIAVGMVLAIGSAVNSFDTHVEGLTQHWFGSPLYVDAESANLSAGQPLPASLGRQLRATKGVRAAFPWRYTTINWDGRPLLLYALPIVEAARQGLGNVVGLAGVNQHQVQGGLGAGGVLVSRFTAHHLGVRAGDTVRIPTPGGLRGFRIAAVFEDVISYDSVVIDHEQYERIWHDSSVDRFAVSPQSGETLAHLRPKLASIVHADELEAEVVTRSQAVKRLFGVLKGTLALGRAFELVGLLVAAAIVFNTMLTAATERQWEFGLTRAIGMTRRGVSLRLAIESLGIGLLGSATALAIGAVLGAFMVTAMNTAFSWGVSYAPDWLTTIAILMLGVVIAVVAAVYPSRVASRATIISSLRLE